MTGQTNTDAHRIPEAPLPLASGGIDSIISFEAPYLVEKLVKEHIVDTPDQAHALFAEVKRYMILSHLNRGRNSFLMYSLRVDEAWHQFILYTDEYRAFSMRFFGYYVGHMPSNAPSTERAPPPVATYDEFAAAYQALFGQSVPDVWLDHLFVTIDRRVVNHDTARLSVRVVADRAELVLQEEATSKVVIRVDAWADAALRFIARAGTFFVRELPGDLDADERVELCATLVRVGLLRMAS